MIASNTPAVSIVLGIRDWGLDRLALALRAHECASIADDVEVIVVDYGSRDEASVRRVVEASCAKLVRVDVRGPWNRSHCLNIGICHANAEWIVTSDADILFAPRTLETLLSSTVDERDFLLVQCHDLPPLPLAELKELDFSELEEVAVLRPPWGMGGCALFQAALAHDLRGFDERMEHWGSEDHDFVQRAMQRGANVRWLDDPHARCFHIWHAKTVDVKSSDKSFREAVNRNRQYESHDATAVRNAFPWGAATAKMPDVSVCIITRNRAALLNETIHSVLAQSWQDFELVIVDDGSTDGTAAVIESIADDRIRYYRQPHRGIPAARNTAVRKAQGDFICVVDDDDIQMPDRIARHLCAVEDGYAGSYGGWIDFDEETRELQYNPGKPFSLEALMYTPKVLIHPGLFMLREVLLEHPYREDVPFGSDFDMIVRVAAAGYRLKHTGRYAIFRRLHHHAVTTSHSAVQTHVGQSALQKLRACLTEEEKQHARNVAKRSAPLELTDPLEDESLILSLPASLARVISIWKSRQREGKQEARELGLGQARLLERNQHTEARLEIGRFATRWQCELNLRRLQELTEYPLAIEPKRQGASEVYYYITWPWTGNWVSWREQSRIADRFRYPSQVILKETAADTATPLLSARQQHKSFSTNGARRLARTVRDVADAVLPPRSIALVVSKGDDRLLDLGRAIGWHFPQTEDGIYAGYHPADCQEAIGHLEELRAKGAAYLVFPSTSLWWLEHYRDFKLHLERRYQSIAYENGACLIYALESPQPDSRSCLSKPLLLPVGG